MAYFLIFEKIDLTRKMWYVIPSASGGFVVYVFKKGSNFKAEWPMSEEGRDILTLVLAAQKNITLYQLFKVYKKRHHYKKNFDHFLKKFNTTYISAKKTGHLLLKHKHVPQFPKTRLIQKYFI